MERLCGLKDKPNECKIDVGNYITIGFVIGSFFTLFICLMVL